MRDTTLACISEESYLAQLYEFRPASDSHTTYLGLCTIRTVYKVPEKGSMAPNVSPTLARRGRTAFTEIC